MGNVRYSYSRVRQTFGRTILGATILLAIGATLHALTLTISPNPIHFGNQAIGASTSLNVTLTNGTHGKIKIMSVSSSLAQFSYSGPPLPVTLQPSQSMSGTVTFTPTASQTFNGILTFTRANGSTITDSLNGVGVQPVAAPSITTQPVSQTVTAGQKAIFSVTAHGTAPLSYQWQKNAAAISGATSSSYTTPATTSSDNGARFTVVVSNSAGTVASSAATLTVNAAAPGALAPNTTSLNFNNVNVGSNSSLSVNFTNSGSSNITISNVTISGAGFTAVGISNGQIITPGQMVTMTVRFAPAATGSATGSVTTISNASNSPVTISFSGTGIVVTHSATLTWTESVTVAGYNVYRGSTSGGPYTKINPSLDPTMSFSDTTVQAGQTYYWVVTAVNSSNVESSYSNQIAATIPTP